MSETAAKKHAPYTSYLRSEDDLIVIRCGSKAWELSKPSDEREASLVFPKGTDPKDYIWPVRGKHVLVISGDEDLKGRAILIVELLNAGAEAVHLHEALPGHENDDWGINAPQVTTYRKPDAQ